MKFFNNASSLIGNTPLLNCEAYTHKNQVDITLFAKLEGWNPGGSAKDRVALFMMEDAEKRGLLTPGGTMIEPTSGNTGIGLAMVGRMKGYQVILTMPDSMSKERRDLLGAYGARLVLTPGAEGMAGAIAKAEELHKQIPGSFIPSQFDNPANPRAHYETTGPEIWRDSEGKVDLLIAGIGTGGTLSGVGQYLKEQDPNIRIVGVEPAESPLITRGTAGPHGIQGIGANFIPKNLNRDVVDLVMDVPTKAAMAAARDFARTQGILVGISSGAVLSAALNLAKLPPYQGKRMVVLLPDRGERYLSTGLFDEI